MYSLYINARTCIHNLTLEDEPRQWEETFDVERKVVIYGETENNLM